MFRFRLGDFDRWLMLVQIDDIEDFLIDFDLDELLEEETTIIGAGQYIPYCESLPFFFQDFESLCAQYETDGATQDYLSLDPQPGLAYEISMAQQGNLPLDSNSRKHNRKYRSDKHRQFPKKRPFIETISSDNDVKIIAELPGISKENIKVRILDDRIANIVARNGNGKIVYNRKVRIPGAVDTDTAKCKFNNAILEIRFDRKKKRKEE
jgi:HSP20 family molecular chaperone IbpA